MSNEIASHTLDVSMAQICITLGWTHTHKTPLHYLSLLTENYLRKIADFAKQSAELNNRTTPNMDDLAFAFDYLQIDLPTMAEYCENVKPRLPLACVVPCVSIPKEHNEQPDVQNEQKPAV